MRTRVTHFTDFTLASGEDVELELEHQPVDGLDTHTVETAEHIIHAYLTYDSDCTNPLDDCDGMGKIHHHPRSRYGRRNDHGYYEALNVDSYGDPIIDEDKMQDIWRAKVMAVPLREFFIASRQVRKEIRCGDDRDYRDILRESLADEAAGDFSVETQCRQAWRYRPDVPRELIADIAERIEDRIDWNYDEVALQCHELGDKDLVMLDLYEHGLCRWSVAGGNGCQWDTSRGEALWVPDKYAREEIDRRAPVFDHAWIEKTNWLRGKGKQYLLHFGDKDGVFSDDWSELWDKAVEIAEACRAAGVEPRFDGRRRAAVEMAGLACEQYTDWSNGTCYGWVVQVHAEDGGLLASDACWGYVGTEYAEETLKEMFDHTVERIKREESAPPHNPNQMEMRL